MNPVMGYFSGFLGKLILNLMEYRFISEYTNEKE